MYFCKSPRKAIEFSLLIAGFLCSSMRLPAQVIEKPEVFLVGTIHDFHFEPQYHYSMPDLLVEVKTLHPDAVCGEISADAYEQAAEGYYPPEAAFLAEMSKDLGYRFIATDWRGDSRKQSKLEDAMSKDETTKLDVFWKKVMGEVKAYKGPSLYDYFHSPEHLQLVDQFFEKFIAADGDIVMGYWHERNHNIVENCLKESTGKKRIVFAYGASHIPQLQRELKEKGIESTVAGRLFTPSGEGQVAPTVVQRWRRNLQGLEGISSGSITASEEYRFRIKHSRRIKDLKQAIDLYSGQKTVAAGLE